MRFNDAEHGDVPIEETASYDAAEPTRLPLLLEVTGFRLEARFGEFTSESFQSTSPLQVCAAVLR